MPPLVDVAAERLSALRVEDDVSCEVGYGEQEAGRPPAQLSRQEGCVCASDTSEPTAGSPPPTPPEVTYRLLCSTKKAGALIGLNGAVIKELRDETGARIEVEAELPGVEERIVSLTATDDPSDESAASPAHAALLAVHAKLLEDENAEPGTGAAAPAPEACATVRLLIDASQSGALIGRGGEIIRSFREQSNCALRILPQEELPPCAAPTDRIVQIIGPHADTTVALALVARQLRSNPPKGGHRNSWSGSSNGGYSDHGQNGFGAGMYPPGAGMYGMAGPYNNHSPYGSPQFGPYGPMYPPGAFLSHGGLVQPPPQQAVCVQVSVQASLVGSIIGKGGQNISSIRHLSGARVKVHELLPGAAERVVEITGSPEQVQTAQHLVHSYALGGGVVRGVAPQNGLCANGAEANGALPNGAMSIPHAQQYMPQYSPPGTYGTPPGVLPPHFALSPPTTFLPGSSPPSANMLVAMDNTGHMAPFEGLPPPMVAATAGLAAGLPIFPQQFSALHPPAASG